MTTCRTCRYNDDSAYNPDNLTEEERKNSHNAYGALVELAYASKGVNRGWVVCQGYADAYLLLCQKVGLDCVYVLGAGNQSGNFTTGNSNHAWNTVKLDGAWYAVDATWDDLDYVFSAEEDSLSTQVEIDGCHYRYFADNRYFVANDEVSQDHKAYSVMSYSSYKAEIRSPALEVTYRAEADTWKMPFVNVYLVDGAALSDVTAVLGEGFSGYALGESELITIHLAGKMNADKAISVPAAQNWRVLGSGVSSSVITRAVTDGSYYTGSLFSVAAGGSLTLTDVTLNGAGPESAEALIVLDKSSGDSTAALSLCDVTLTANPGTGVSAGGTVSVSGAVNIADNRMNLSLGSSGKVVVTDALTGRILIRSEKEGPCVFPAEGYDDWAQEQTVFGADDSHQHLTYDEAQDALCLENWFYTADGLPVRIGYLKFDSAAELSGSTVRLQNTGSAEKTVWVFAAVYDGSGQLLQIETVGGAAVTLAADGTMTSLALPEWNEQGAYYKIFVLSQTSYAPLSEAAVWDFSAAA